MTKCLIKCCSQSSLQDKKELLPCARCALLLVNVSRSVRAAGGRAHRVLRLSRSLPPLQISSPEPLKRRTRHGVIRLVEQRVGFWREVVGSNLQLPKIIWPSSRKLCPREAFFHLPFFYEAVSCPSHGPPPREVPIFPWGEKILMPVDKVACTSTFSRFVFHPSKMCPILIGSKGIYLLEQLGKYIKVK